MGWYFVRAVGLTGVLLQAIFIIRTASQILHNEPNLLEVDAPITGEHSSGHSLSANLKLTNSLLLAVCGDIHGQYVSQPAPGALSLRRSKRADKFPLSPLAV